MNGAKWSIKILAGDSLEKITLELNRENNERPEE
jgi:hypothetical protein